LIGEDIKMKVRTGFVSNSSSTSFAILGLEVSKRIKDAFETMEINKIKKEQDKKGIPEFIDGCNHTFDRETYSFCPYCGNKEQIKNPEYEEELDYDFDLYDFFEDYGWEHHRETEYGDIFGICISSIPEDSTIKEAKEKFIAYVNKYSGMNISANQVSLMIGSYYS